MNHRELCFDLALAKGTQFIEVPLGPVWGSGPDPGRADVINIKPSYTRFCLDIYECKVSRPDVLSELRSHKYERYLAHCNRLYFACTKGIIDKSEMPEGVGLIIRGEKGWKTVKSTPIRDTNIPIPTLLAITFYRGRVFSKRRMSIGNNYQYRDGKERYAGLARDVRRALFDYDVLLCAFKDLLNTNAEYEIKGSRSWEEKLKWKERWIEKFNKGYRLNLEIDL